MSISLSKCKGEPEEDSQQQRFNKCKKEMAILTPYYLNVSRRLLGLLVIYDLISRYTTHHYYIKYSLLDLNSDRETVTSTTTNDIDGVLCHINSTSTSSDLQLLSNISNPIIHTDVLNSYFKNMR